MTRNLRFKLPLKATSDLVIRISSAIDTPKLLLCLALYSFTAVWQTAHATDPYELAKNQVISQPCLDDETIDQFLDHKRRPSHRDLGWRVFQDDEGYIVERSFMVSKAMEIRYRWHVDTQGSIYPTNSRTENLCS